MFELTADNAPTYLEARGIGRPLAVTELGGGVSNTVLLVDTGCARFVLKQSLGKLRVEQDWFSDRARIFRESAAIRLLGRHLPAGSLPEILFDDRDNCIFAMSAAPEAAQTWKTLLLRGAISCETAALIGRLLASMIRVTWSNAEFKAQFGDQTVFDELRLDPYYRATALRHPDLAPRFERLIQESSLRCVSLVHGDWSPKNFLVYGSGVMAIDFEVIHFGDPTFDAAFLLNHLALKSFFHPNDKPQLTLAAASFWRELLAGAPPAQWWESGTIAHLGALMLARIDGKSPVEYLNAADLRERVRQFARQLIENPPDTLDKVFA